MSENTIKAVDLGLSVKWANQNIKSASDSSKDAFFAWGCVKEQDKYTTDSYSYYKQDISKDGYLPLEKDAAAQNWGGKWRMPTINEWNELINNCTWTEGTDNGTTDGVAGYYVTGNGNTIFIPMSGMMVGNELHFEGTQGEYWTSECKTSNFLDAYGTTITNVSIPFQFVSGNNDRYAGFTIRPIYDESLTPTTPDNTGQDDTDDNTVSSYAVDLGLSVKWAKWNIGATAEEEVGSYIAWGDPTGKNTSYVNSDYPNPSSGDIAGTEYDTATVLWGNGWKMPTAAEWAELDNLTKELVTLSNGVKVFKVTASNGNYIYLPRGGYQVSKGLQEYNVSADYWTSENTSQTFAKGVRVGKVSSTFEPEDQKGWHMLVRPVYKKGGGTDGSTFPLTDEGKAATAVDLGLSVKWATYNLGTTDSNDPGAFFAWAETTPRAYFTHFSDVDFSQNSYKWYDASTGTFNIPATDISYTSNDAASKLWGGTWRMPTEDEMYELVQKCTWVKEDYGFRITGPNGNEIFLPFTGFFSGNSLGNTQKLYYWSANYNDIPLHAEDYWSYYLSSYTSGSETLPTIISTYVYNGLCIRPVSGGDVEPTPDPDPDNPDPEPTPDPEPDPTPTPTPDPDDGDDDTPTSSKALTFTDTYDSGYSVDSNVILYAGGQEVIPKTMTQKDNTLFLGNYKQSSMVLSQETLDLIKANCEINYTYFENTDIPKGETGSLYMYENQLSKNSYEIASFKGNEVYRFGLVFQDRRGEWSEAVYIGDKVNDLYPQDNGDSFLAPKAKIILTSSIVNKLYNMGYRKAKAVVVYPSINNRLAVCQGVLCPTVYSIDNRKNNSPYAMSSWFFREMHSTNYVESGTQNRHNICIYNDIPSYLSLTDRVFATPTADNSTKVKNISQFRAEISCASVNPYYAQFSVDSKNIYVDWNTVTMNTPEVDFSLQDTASTIPTENLKLRIIGIIPLTSNASDITVSISTQPVKKVEASFQGLRNNNDNNSNISYKGSTLRLTKFEWYDYSYLQGKDGKDWNNDKQYFDSVDDLVNNITLPNGQNYTYNTKVYKDHRAYPLYPWQGAKSLVGQPKVAVNTESGQETKDSGGIIYDALKYKKISNIRTSAFTYYFPTKAISYDIGNVGLFSGDIPLIKLNGDTNDVDHAGMFNYYGEVDTLIAPTDYYEIYNGLIYSTTLNNYSEGKLKDIARVTPIGKTNDTVRIKYKSFPHLACHLNYTKDGKQELLPNFTLRGYLFGMESVNDIRTGGDATITGNYYISGWSDRILDKTTNKENVSQTSTLHQNNINLSYPIFPFFSVTDYERMGYMYIGEFYKDAPSDLSQVFGGSTPLALEKNQWHTAGPSVEIIKDEALTVKCLQGDTYYQRYDSLKTYPYTTEDPNQLVEILSFMCETRMNIDGRYDHNRGMTSNLYMNNVNFNLFNSAYTQQDNFFNYYFLDPERNAEDAYPNGFVWSKSKTMGEEIDTWSSLNTSSSYSLDGDKGDLYALINWNDTLMSFQENGIARILYNDRVQIATNDGTPIEIANSTKVSGKQYMSTTVGCSNKRVIQITPKGIYFMDGNSKDLYIIGNSIDSLSKTKGFNSYFYNKDISKYRTFYDEKSSDIYFLDDTESLVFSESLNEFEGFYDYGGTDYMFNYKDSFLSIKDNSIWKQFAGDYNMFYGKYKPFWLTLISNDGNSDKTFGNIEFEADSWHSDNTLADTTFDHLSAWDEYQMGESVLRTLNTNVHYHFSNLKRKFRIWRANIPRDIKLKNMTFPEALNRMQAGDINKETGKILNMTEGLDRIRNTWAYIRLLKFKENTDKTTLHGIKVNFFN